MEPDWAPLKEAVADASRDFARGLADPAGRQRQLLARILAENVDCEFGRNHRFDTINGFESYCARVPVRNYASFMPDISRMADCALGVLTTAPVVAFEETGGTSAGAKLIPYTAAGLDGFRKAVLPWLGDLAQRRPRIASGRAYVTISPATRQVRRTVGGLSIGLSSDAAYLGEELAPAFATLLAVPGDVAFLGDVTEWQVRTLVALVAAHDLSFVSLWSPTFLLTLLDSIESNADAVFARLDETSRLRLKAALADEQLDTKRLWPQLDCISCWKDGISANYARQLGQLFPNCAIENKGLLATEAAVTVPWGAHGLAVPAIDSCLIEFHDTKGEPHLCDSLRSGEVYRTVITTRSGLYRYELGDQLECVGQMGPAPLLRFIGRAGVTSDLVGEKLDEGFVASALATLDGPAMLVAHAIRQDIPWSWKLSAETRPPKSRRSCCVIHNMPTLEKLAN